MKNKAYPLYNKLPIITDLRQMLEIKAQNQPDDIAFRYMRDRKTLVERSYGTFYRDVQHLGTYLLKRGIRNR